MLRSAYSLLCQILVLGYMVAYAGAFVWTRMQTLCQYPLVSSMIRSCDTINSNLTVWAALPLLLGAQTNGMETVMNHTDIHADLIMDLSETRVASIDLSILVRSSKLEYREQISGLVSKLADDALDLNRGLQHLSAKIGAGFNQIMSTNGQLYRQLRMTTSSPETMPNLNRCRINSMSRVSNDCFVHIPYPDVTHAYDRTLQTYESVLRDLIQVSTTALIKATVLDADLISTMNLVAREKLGIVSSKKELGSLWNLLGGRTEQLAHYAHNEHILTRVGDYSAKSLRYVHSIQDALETMQRQLEELRSVASGALLSDIVSPEVILDMLTKGLERLGSARTSSVERHNRLLLGSY